MQDQHWRTSVPVEGEYAGMADYPVVHFVIMEERPFIKPGSLKTPQNRFGFPKTLFREQEVPRLMRLRRNSYHNYRRSHTIFLELTKRGAGMTTLFLLFTGVCQSSLNELGVASVTKKWSGQNRTSRTACYGPVSRGVHMSVVCDVRLGEDVRLVDSW